MEKGISAMLNEDLPGLPANPKLSVCMIAYNHGRFIAQALDSVIEQQTNFDFELVIGEDFSTDNTRQVVVEYQRKYPGRIRLLLHDLNIGMAPNFIRTIQACHGQYIALLEGDDYWTDPFKLQKQVDFLDGHPDFAICFTDARTLNEITGRHQASIVRENIQEWPFERLLGENFIPTLTCVFRNGLIENKPRWLDNAFPIDWPLHILNALHGKIGYIDYVTATYRVHSGGISSWSNPEPNYNKLIKTLEAIKTAVPVHYSNILERTIQKNKLRLCNIYLKSRNISQARELLRSCIRVKSGAHLPLKLLLFLKIFFYRLLPIKWQ